MWKRIFTRILKLCVWLCFLDLEEKVEFHWISQSWISIKSMGKRKIKRRTIHFHLKQKKGEHACTYYSGFMISSPTEECKWPSSCWYFLFCTKKTIYLLLYWEEKLIFGHNKQKLNMGWNKIEIQWSHISERK